MNKNGPPGEALGVELVEGREFDATDETNAPRVAIINQAFAKRWFPGPNPIGQHVEIGLWRGEFIHPSLEGPAVEIVGVAADVREISQRSEPRRTLYVPATQALTAVFLGLLIGTDAALALDPVRSLHQQ